MKDPSKYYFNKKIRWANAGKHYDWDNRCYFKDPGSSVPALFKNLASEAAAILTSNSFYPEAMITNYYGVKDTMGGHLDDGEPDQEHPILSFSLGLSCVFLMGGHTKSVEPWPVKLNSGDLVIMSKDARRCYHGVPRILENSFNIAFDQNLEETKEDDDEPGVNNLQNAANFLKEHRINFNFRQVTNHNPY